MQTMETIETQVLIVGGGGAGLSASSFLADLGVESLLVERHPGTSHLPKAHYINQRAMEIFRQHSMADDIYAKASPRDKLGKILWRTPLGGDAPSDQKIIKAVDALGGGELTADYDLYGVTPPTHITQMALEPILLNIAKQRNPNKVLFSHEMVSFTQTEKGIEALVRDLNNDNEFKVYAQFLLAADAGKTIGPAIGVNMIGPIRMMTRVSVHFAADLSGHIPEDTAAMHCVVNPNGAKAGEQLFTYLIAYGPNYWGKNSEEWGISLAFAADEEVNLDEEHLVERIKAFLQVDVPIKVLKVSQWFQEAMVADKFAEGRITLIGDAAHKHPPGGGLGLNSGIQDAHNICWKLALILQGLATDKLLRSYEIERRPVVERNAKHSILVMENFMILLGSLGVMDGAPPEYNQAQINALFADGADGDARRQRVDKVFELAASETGLQDLDIGYLYQGGAIIDDRSPPVPRDPAAIRYTPSTRPGSRLPHVWLRKNGSKISTHDLIPLGGFVLITGNRGHSWCVAAQNYAVQTGLILHAVCIGNEQNEISDPSLIWQDLCGINADGAILVRPDAHVAFRSKSAASNTQEILAAVLKDILTG